MPKCPCVVCTCGDDCKCAPGDPGCDPCGDFQRSNKALVYLARRSAMLSDYDPPKELPALAPAGGWPLQGATPSALVVHGCSMVAVPQAAADLFVDVLYPAGCRVILLTGGVGRETPPLWKELAERGMTGLFADAPWARDATPKQVTLRTQGGVVKPVLDHVALEMPPDELRRYCAEADIFLEIVCARCRERGLPLQFGGNPMGGDFSRPDGAAPCIFIETASTHTGTNVAFSASSLELLGFAAPLSVAVVQQPQLHMRTTLTWEKQTGAAPLAWTVRPTEAALGRPRAELLRYALGELKRIPAYAASDKAFCVLPPDWDAVGPAFTKAVEAHAAAEPAACCS
eukprot:Transcript_2475.p1 GENE.Transcript_2475~~Transcript_2475.p1  ORF type:complete len:369 (+),score=92.18 Transcript_2475:81-1109(+)